MGKKLITLKEINRMYAEGIRELYVNDKVIITPGARDFAHDKGFRVIYGVGEDAPKEDVKSKIDLLLQQQYQVLDQELRRLLVEKILEKLKNNS